MRVALKVAIAAGLTFGVIQVVRFERTNPPIVADLQAQPELKRALRRACYDCHSNETVWPWYSAVAPASWIAHYDVSAGRSAVNFSDWGTLPPQRQREKMKEIGESVSEGEMPPWYYVPLHPQARFSDSEKAAIETWVGPPGGGP